MILAEQPRLLLVAGPNGAGKTTVTERGLAHEWFARCAGETSQVEVFARGVI
ncbi:hypothetical protein NTGBS_190004 [Candidatus Nitrotoga sp. BS]|uniref:hypothetical protein n=1 Tax=Candidatus Nitrotoga sp. BS TaxID=2890408 RepID=UPI001EF24F54|nr:hypothetical protein [Candidatus Nitrotoga sp. BS]CAH1194831.1 hypothetical protein NTGBS_190004 [Candidatus Nitrotoga sp. BS]